MKALKSDGFSIYRSHATLTRMFKSVSSFPKIPKVLQSSSSSVSSTLIDPYFTCLEPVVVLFIVRVICTIMAIAGHNLYTIILYYDK